MANISLCVDQAVGSVAVTIKLLTEKNAPIHLYKTLRHQLTQPAFPRPLAPKHQSKEFNYKTKKKNGAHYQVGAVYIGSLIKGISLSTMGHLILGHQTAEYKSSNKNALLFNTLIDFYS